MRRRKLLDQATIARLEARLADIEPFEDIARAIHERTAAGATETGNLELAYRAAVAEVGRDARAERLLAAFDEMSATARYEILSATFDDADLRRVLASRREVARQRAQARCVRALDLRALHPGQLVEIGLFQRHRVDTALRLGRRSDFCSRELTVQAEGQTGCVRVVADQLLLRGAYDGTSEYPRDEWEHEALPDHAVLHVGVAVTDGAHESFDPVLRLGSRFDVERDGQVLRSRLAVGFVEVDGEDLFTLSE